MTAATPAEDPGGLASEVAALREFVSTLSAATLRITATLDVKAVLQEVVDSACLLSRARYGAIATIDAGGALVDFVTTGLADDELRRLTAWPEGPQLFEHLRKLPGPTRLDDLSVYAGEVGLPPDPMLSHTLCAVPLRHRGILVGTFFVSDKEGAQPFVAEDEEVLVLFAAQAAAAVANARAPRRAAGAGRP